MKITKIIGILLIITCIPAAILVASLGPQDFAPGIAILQAIVQFIAGMSLDCED